MPLKDYRRTMCLRSLHPNNEDGFQRLRRKEEKGTLIKKEEETVHNVISDIRDRS